MSVCIPKTMEKVLSHTRKVLVNDKGKQPDGSASGSDAERPSASGAKRR